MSAAEQAQTATAAATAEEPGKQWLDLAEKSAKPRDDVERDRTRAYFKEFVGQLGKHESVSKDVEQNIKFWINEIDRNLSVQLNEVMHSPEFQKLEGELRGLHYLVHQSETGEMLRIRVLNVTKRELFKDFEKASEFDQTALFKKIYEEEYGMLGGHPYGMLVGDYEFDRTPEEVGLLTHLSRVAAAAQRALVAAASPGLFNMSRFTELSKPRDLAMVFQSVEHTVWKSFRDSEDSRYVALTLPRVLARLPYGEKFKTIDEFKFEEMVDGTDHDKYLWMNSAWAYAARITDAMAKYGWMARSRGVKAGGKVEGLPVHTFPTDDGDVAMKCPTEIAITDRRENELSNLGFLPLLHCKGTDFAAFLGAQTCQKPKTYFDPIANANAELSTKINYIMCVSRFAHYLKVMVRDQIGEFMERHDMERWLNEWINHYVLADAQNAGPEMRARKPLAAARVDVQEVKGKPGWYEAVAYLRPHFQLEGLSASMRLVAELPKRPGG